MNLHGIVGPVIASVNPYVLGQYQKSSGYTTDEYGARAPRFMPAITVQIQMQALTYKDTIQLSGLNLNGEKHAMYISGNWQSVSRPDSVGGDLITLADGSVWMVVQVLENWHDANGWVKVAVTQQNNK